MKNKVQYLIQILLTTPIFLAGLVPACGAQQVGKGTKKPAAQKPNTPSQATPPASSAAVPANGAKPDSAPAAQSSIAKVASTASNQTDLEGDYIPCKFTLPQLRALIAPEVASTLTEADEVVLKERVIDAVIAQNNDPSLSSIDIDAFINTLSHETLHGLTPDKALNRIIQDLAASKQPVVSVEDVDALQSKLVMVLPKDKDVIDKFTSNLKPLVKDTPKDQLPSKALSEWGNFAKQNNVPSAVRTDIQAALAVLPTPDNSQIVQAARNAVGILERPPDIGCAMSILTYNETDQAFGHLIASTYIAVQVVVRNLNRTQSFVLHDVEFEVNADPTGRLGRFFSGRDKVVVRALSAAQNSFDPRAIAVHSAMGVGAIMSAALPIFSNAALTGAAAVFNGAFVPTLDKYWKDQTAEQLNLLNDTGFSSQSSSQTVVPQSGTVMFVTFIPSKQFDQGWWTQPCVEKLYLGTTNQTGVVANLATGDSAYLTGDSISGATGIDVERALEVCQVALKTGGDPLPLQKKNDNKILEIPTGNSATQGDISAHSPNVDLFRNAYARPYKKWPGNSLSIFRELSNVVVSGTHIIEDSQLTPSLSAINCSYDSSGNLIFPTPEKDTLTCPLVGKNLDKISQLRLRDSKNQLNTDIAEGEVSLAAGNATVTFKTATLHSLSQPAYDVFTVSSQGVEQKTSLTIHIPTDPHVTKIAPDAFDFSKSAAPKTLTITGDHLQAVDTVVFTNADSSKKASVSVKQDDSKSETQLAVPLDPTALKDFGTTEVDLTLSVAVGSKVTATGEHIKYTGSAAKPNTTVKTATPHVTSISPEAFDFSKDSQAETLKITGTNLQAVDAVILTNADGSKKVSISLKKAEPNSVSQLLVPIDPASLQEFGVTKVVLSVTLGVGSKTTTTDKHFDYTGSPAKPSNPK